MSEAGIFFRERENLAVKRKILLEIWPWNICAKISEYPNISASANSLQQSSREEEASDWVEDKKEEAEAGAVEVEEEYGKIEGDGEGDDQDKSDDHDDDQY